MVAAVRFWNTIRYLKPIQVFGRIWCRTVRPRVDVRPAPTVRSLATRWVPSPERAPSLVGHGRFQFLNETRELEAHGWEDAAIPRLWRYNMHYFDDLNARDAAQRVDWHRDLLERWVRENRPVHGT